VTYEDSIRVLLRGMTGVNASVVNRATRVRHDSTLRFCCGETIPEPVMDRLALFVWRQMNAKVLICEEDERHPIESAPRKMPRKWSRHRKSAPQPPGPVATQGEDDR
jgi:hypothetical protein